MLSMHYPTRHKQHGIAAAEFVITLPVLLLVMLATAEIGRALYQFNTLAKSTRDATRYLSTIAINDGTLLIHIDNDKEEQVKNLLVYGNFDGSGDPILPDLDADAVTVSDIGNLHVQISVTYPYQTMLGTGIPTFGLGNGNIDTAFTFNCSVAMRAT